MKRLHVPELVKRLWRNERAAIAPLTAMSLFALFAVGGIAFDYARLAAMDTELQQAADLAALAAATQLDRAEGAQSRATAAIQDPDNTKRLAANFTRFANDGSDNGPTVEIASITFCSAFDDSVADTATACTATTDDGESRFVVVTTALRTANYAFTPIVAAFFGTSQAGAVAGVESSICNIAPLFVCTPPGENFPEAGDIGKGLLLKTGAQNSWAPGNYGYLDFGSGNPGIIDALLGHGLNGCQPIDESNTAPGDKNATDAINTRFDVYAGTGVTKDPSICDLSTGSGCPAPNTGKDMTMTMAYEITQNKNLAAPTPPSCDAAATAKNTNPSVQFTNFALNPGAKGFPRDTCHYSSCTNGNFGNGTWTYAAYMAANHPGVDTTTVPKQGTTPTRYEVYTWELAQQATGAMDSQQIGATIADPNNPKLTGPSNATYKFTKVCAYRKPRVASSAYPAQKDRRILPVVAANCTGLNGVGNLDEFQAIRVFDVFLTEPSLNRTVAAGYPGPTDDKEIYGEVLGPSETFAGTSGFQYYSRNKPYLVR